MKTQRDGALAASQTSLLFWRIPLDSEMDNLSIALGRLLQLNGKRYIRMSY